MKTGPSKQTESEFMTFLKPIESGTADNIFDGKAESTSTILLKQVRLYDCALLQITHASLQMTTKNGNEIIIPPYSICYIEKNTVFKANLSVLHGEGYPYNIYHLKTDLLKDVCKVMELAVSEHNAIAFANNKKVFFFHAMEAEHTIFRRLLNTETPQHRIVYKIAYLLSRFEPHFEVIHSLERCIAPTLTEKVKQVISLDLTKQWHLCDLSKQLHMSEINIRKKLEAEGNNFNALLQDMRMQEAARMLKRTNAHINECAKMTGYTSTSYFIKVFKEYFGVTPKQFSLKMQGRYTLPTFN